MKKIVLIDDNWVIRGILAERLEESGFKVYLAEDGIEAMGLIYIIEPQVVLIDKSIPKFDGFQLTKTLRSNKKFDALKIYFLMDEYDDVLFKKIKHLGVEEIFEKKDLDIDYLLKKINSTQESENE